MSIDLAAISPSQRGFLRNFELANDVSLTVIVTMAVAIIAGTLLARATVIVARNSNALGSMRPHVLSGLIGLLSNVSVLAMFIAGLWVTHWYWPVGFLFAGFVLSGLMLNSITAVAFYKLNNEVGLAVIAATLVAVWFLWV